MIVDCITEIANDLGVDVSDIIGEMPVSDDKNAAIRTTSESASVKPLIFGERGISYAVK